MQRPLKLRRGIGAMLPTQGPSVPDTKRTFSGRVSWETKVEACSKEVGHPRPSAFAVYIRSELDCVVGLKAYAGESRPLLGCVGSHHG
jgi:hypothetical protein